MRIAKTVADSILVFCTKQFELLNAKASVEVQSPWGLYYKRISNVGASTLVIPSAVISCHHWKVAVQMY